MKTTTRSIRISVDLKKQLERRAKAQKRSFNNLVEIVLSRYVEGGSSANAYPWDVPVNRLR